MEKQDLVNWAEDWLLDGREGDIKIVTSVDDPFVVTSEGDSRPGSSYDHWYATNWLRHTDGDTKTKVLDRQYNYPTTDWIKERHYISGWTFIILEGAERASYNDCPDRTDFTIVLRPGDPLIAQLQQLADQCGAIEDSAIEAVQEFVSGRKIGKFRRAFRIFLEALASHG